MLFDLNLIDSWVAQKTHDLFESIFRLCKRQQLWLAVQIEVKKIMLLNYQVTSH